MKKYFIELVTEGNQVLFKCFLNLKEITSNEESEKPNPEPAKKENNKGKCNEKGELLMVEKQKRELFRQSAEKGLEKEEAHKKLLEHFGVDSLKDVTYSQAQTVIDKMQQDKEKKE